MSRHSDSICCLCEREMKRGTTQHHLIPRKCHSNKWFKKRFSRQEMAETIAVCHPCHHAIHDFVPSHKQLGRHYNTREKLLQHEEISTFVDWIRQQK